MQILERRKKYYAGKDDHPAKSSSSQLNYQG